MPRYSNKEADTNPHPHGASSSEKAQKIPILTKSIAETLRRWNGLWEKLEQMSVDADPGRGAGAHGTFEGEPWHG
jgi:hypothetical protein